MSNRDLFTELRSVLVEMKECSIKGENSKMESRKTPYSETIKKSVTDQFTSSEANPLDWLFHICKPSTVNSK